MNRKIFFEGIRSGPFSGLKQPQVDGVNFILDEWDRRKLTDPRHLAYILATAFWETARTMQPIREMGGQSYLRSKRYYPWFGRGYVQLTWKANYQRYRDEVLKLFNVDIVANPDNAMKPDAAAYIMFDGMYKGAFTGKKLGDYFTATGSDWINARRIINGTDKASQIAAIAKQFYADIIAAKESTE